MRSRCLILTVGFAVLFGALSAIAETSARKSFTWSPKPYEKTKTYMVQSFRAGYNLVAPSLPQYLDSDGAMFSYETGLMFNVNKKVGLGVGGWLALEDQRSRVGVGPRARFWLSRFSALDISAGPIVAQLDEPPWQVDNLTLFTTATYSFHENLLLTLHFESVKYSSTTDLFYIPPDFPLGKRKNYLYASVGTGGDYGLLAAGASFVALLVAVAIAFSGGTIGLG